MFLEERKKLLNADKRTRFPDPEALCVSEKSHHFLRCTGVNICVALSHVIMLMTRWRVLAAELITRPAFCKDDDDDD